MICFFGNFYHIIAIYPIFRTRTTSDCIEFEKPLIELPFSNTMEFSSYEYISRFY